MSKDYFSSQAALYQQFRPHYPDTLFAFLTAGLKPGALVWDCATGNGQAALGLARCETIEALIASDQSDAQLAQAQDHPRVHYVQAMAEQVPLADHSVDLVTVAQALHWFEFDAFYREVKRVLKADGLFAAWTYSFLSVTPQLGTDLDAAIRQFYRDVIGAYWPPERRWVDQHYRAIPFPFVDVAVPEITIDVAWNLPMVLGYMSSWSAVQLYKDDRQHDPMPEFAARLTPLWGEPERIRKLRWPLGVRVGRL